MRRLELLAILERWKFFLGVPVVQKYGCNRGPLGGNIGPGPYIRKCTLDPVIINPFALNPSPAQSTSTVVFYTQPPVSNTLPRSASKTKSYTC